MEDERSTVRHYLGAFIVLLHTTAEWGDSLHWPLRLLFSYDHMEKVHSNHIKREQDGNELRTRAGRVLDRNGV
jgi:hypothetical protein